MSTLSSAKKMGRPKVDTEPVNVRMDREMLERLDNWRDQDERMASRPNAVRLLVDYALDHMPPSRSE
jgi:hypothetical protein